MKHLCFLLILVLAFSKTKAQKHHNIWHFGQYASLNFNSGVPVATDNSKMDTQEGCTTIADENGNLLFYTNGVTVWNKNHVPMQNGTGLLGHESATQGVIAVPKPGSDKIYYLFTVDAIETYALYGFRYSIVDMSLDNGLGAVTSVKNVLLETPVTEKLTAVLHSNGYHYWILVHKWNSSVFSAYLLTENGISTSPVLSNAGERHEGYLENSHGGMKVSRSGSKLAIAVNRNMFELFQFNNNTGAISLLQSSTPTYMLAYDVEFSPDETKLYCSGHNDEVYQFDLTQPNVFNTGIFISTLKLGAPSGALQLGPDNKIYKARDFTEYIGVINNPNQAGAACNYVNNGVYMGNYYSNSGLKHKSRYGLPSYPSGGFPIKTFLSENNCAGNTTSFSVPNYNTSYQVTWNFGDPQSGALNNASGSNPAHIYNTPGNYAVTLTINKNGFSRIIKKTVVIASLPDANLGNDTILCQGSRLLLQKPVLDGVEYLWPDGSTGNYYLIAKPGTYKLQVKKNNCVAADSIKVSFVYCPIPKIPNIITPNGDAFNDKFKTEDLPLDYMQIKILNRWGLLVFESDNYKNDWDAKHNSAGIYYYIITIKDTGKTYKGWVEVVK